MGSKLGLVLSLLFIAQLFAIAADIIGVQFVYTNLDAVSVSVGYLISQKGEITQEVIDLVHDEAKAEIVEIGESTRRLGDVFQYSIYKDYDAFYINQGRMRVAVNRSVVIGYIN